MGGAAGATSRGQDGRGPRAAGPDRSSGQRAAADRAAESAGSKRNGHNPQEPGLPPVSWPWAIVIVAVAVTVTAPVWLFGLFVIIANSVDIVVTVVDNVRTKSK